MRTSPLAACGRFERIDIPEPAPGGGDGEDNVPLFEAEHCPFCGWIDAVEAFDDPETAHGRRCRACGRGWGRGRSV